MKRNQTLTSSAAVITWMLALLMSGFGMGCSALLDTQECSTDNDCAALALDGQVLICTSAQVCEELPGAQCTQDADCGGGQSCNDYICTGGDNTNNGDTNNGSVNNGDTNNGEANNGDEACAEPCGEGESCVEGSCVPDAPEGPVEVSGEIAVDTTWERGRTYQLSGLVLVESGVTLTIQPGVTVLGEPGSALVVKSGGHLAARGNQNQPIVFTSSQPAGQRIPGDWGGISLLGQARVNEPNALLEGLPVEHASYGGGDDNWNCGVMEYVRIEFAGYAVANNKELNALTLAGCGTDTLIDHVQIHKGKDDGLEIFGGTVSPRYILITQAQDDSLDWDRGWRGGIQFLAVQQDANGENAIEADNWEDDPNAIPRSAPVICNATFVGDRSAREQRGALLRRGTAGEIANSIFMGYQLYAINIHGEESGQQVRDGALTLHHNLFYDIAGDAFFPEEAESDDGDLDEASTFMDEAMGNLFNADPDLSDPFNLRAPGLVPEEGSVVEGAGVIPSEDEFDSSANYLGAFAPGQTPWTAGWTAFDEN